MNFANTPPPNYEEIKKYFPNANFEEGVIFTYGDTCYCKAITADLIVHEKVHCVQQVDPKAWWDRYFIDYEFRLSQELQAYQMQWAFIKINVKDRNIKARMLHSIALDLSGPIYNNLVSYAEAVKLIKQ